MNKKPKKKQKDEFISIASHELKTPLTTAKAYIQLVQHSMKQKNNPDVIYADKADAAIDKLNNLVAELLDVTKIQHGKLGMNISFLILMICWLMQLRAYRFHQKNIQLY